MAKRRKILGLFSLFLGLVLTITPNAKALEIIISDNGSGSGNEVNTQVETTTTVEQNNDANVSNDVDAQGNTGGNEASDNTGGDVDVTTGNVDQEVSLATSVNNSVAQIGCCPSDTSVEISGNGVDSQNTVNATQVSQTTVSVNQTASISNSIDGIANSGENKANDNTGGNVSIQTGDINAVGGIDNGPINSARVTGGSGGGDVSIKISGNGADSVNNISTDLVNSSNVFLNFTSYLNNFVNWDLNTGRNEANGNTGGDVRINTGDIDFRLLIENIANIGEVDIGCCSFDPGEPPGDGEEPPRGGPGDPPGGDGGGNGDGGGGGGGDGGGGGGGLEILGLSDTSSEHAQTLFFFVGLAMILGGARILASETNGRKKKNS